MTISNNSFIDAPSRAVQICDGVVSNNYFSGAGYQAGAHADAVCIYNTTGPVTITGNYIDWTNNANAPSITCNAIQIATDIGSISNVTVTNNIILGGQYSINVGNGYAAGASFSNVNISNNFIGDYVYGAYYGTDPAGVTLGAYTDVGFDNPDLSTAAWSAYLAEGIVTDSLVTAAPGQTSIVATTTGSTTLYGDGVSGVHMNGGKGETIYVGGAGTQFMWGGSGANIYSYLAVSDSTVDSPDAIGNFHVATDIIDLHALNADPASTTPVNFTFIGNAAFSGAGGQVCVIQNVAANQTLVEADLVGDSTPDLEIRIQGLVNLTAANFALTDAQYEADTAPFTT
ncbi:M10 family metallopeptidase C-terminal domain-containing protein, partial [Rhodoblastus sp.]|uniref:M10 family metallopeptidase C-terminal domain-containing protein n=1 Tax=Rhodoblastus sp. TaxID=1962975 RepID=UPI003F9DE8FF